MSKYIILVNEVNGENTPCVVIDIVLDLNYELGYRTLIFSDLNKAKTFDSDTAFKIVKKDFGKNYKVIKVNI